MMLPTNDWDNNSYFKVTSGSLERLSAYAPFVLLSRPAHPRNEVVCNLNPYSRLNIRGKAVFIRALRPEGLGTRTCDRS